MSLRGVSVHKRATARRLMAGGGGIHGQEGDCRVGLEYSIHGPDVELLNVPDPQKCTKWNVLMINQDNNWP